MKVIKRLKRVVVISKPVVGNQSVSDGWQPPVGSVDGRRRIFRCCLPMLFFSPSRAVFNVVLHPHPVFPPWCPTTTLLSSNPCNLTAVSQLPARKCYCCKRDTAQQHTTHSHKLPEQSMEFNTSFRVIKYPDYFFSLRGGVNHEEVPKAGAKIVLSILHLNDDTMMIQGEG